MKRTCVLLSLLAIMLTGWQKLAPVHDHSIAYDQSCKLQYGLQNKVLVAKNPNLPGSLLYWFKCYTFCVTDDKVTNDCTFEVVASLRKHLGGNVWENVPTTGTNQSFSDPCQTYPATAKYRNIFISLGELGPGQYEGDIYIFSPKAPTVQTPELPGPGNVISFPVQFTY